MNPFLFIVGCPRSGTTLLARIVRTHSRIAMTPEKMVDWFRGEAPPRERLVKLGLDADEVAMLQERSASYSELVTALFDLYGRKQGKELVGNKTPRYVAELPRLHGLFPEARFVHLVRDGRDVCLSLLEWRRKRTELAERLPTWRLDPLVTVALWWKSLVSTGCGDGAELGPDRYFELRYEQLVTSPEPETRRLCAFLRVDYEEQMLRFHEGRTRSDAGLSAKRAWLPITPGLRDWRVEMAPIDVEAFEAAAGDLLDELGYERGAGAPRAATRTRVARVTERMSNEVVLA
jgi:hypothetical protein